MGELVRIRNDLYGIADRLREADDRYEVYFNRRLNRFEVHAGGVLQVAVPFERLDARTVEHVRRTRVERARVVLDEIDRANRAAEDAARKRARETFCAATGV